MNLTSLLCIWYCFILNNKTKKKKKQKFNPVLLCLFVVKVKGSRYSSSVLYLLSTEEPQMLYSLLIYVLHQVILYCLNIVTV